ncbi:methionine--tRNA ligase [Kineosporia sp. A_224]|uniref:methionine--tRNA ligase n=1 Tax=Kineosporia sp. A_224 TaxID=1962180 RepID=UPI0018E9AFF5|nr:methionine--tRNA ligase [Kineosporia sp. A_224]
MQDLDPWQDLDTLQDLYVTASIPYVNGAPHLGHALELVHADVLARHRRLRGGAARLQSGTDDHALKNVTAARGTGVAVDDLVARNGDRFVALSAALGVRPDAFVRTSRHPGHADAVREVWRRCAAAGDLYPRSYSGLYCTGCEQFYAAGELTGGRCPEHGTVPDEVTETNWFFRLSRYAGGLARLVADGVLDVVPAARRNEVLGFLAGEVEDVSVSRPAARAQGWGVPVPGDPGQVVYVWFDALVNYVSGLGWPANGPDDGYQRWWAGGAGRVHVVGKGIARFHTVLWPALLLSAGLPLPTRVLVHDYLTVEGAKIAKSGAQAADPAALVASYGVDAVRWWLVREPAPLTTTDFTVERLVGAHDRDLANGVGNLVSRTVALARRRPVAAGPGRSAGTADAHDLLARVEHLPVAVDAAVARYDLRAACTALTDVVADAGRFVGRHEPWHLARAAADGDATAGEHFDAVLGVLLSVCTAVAHELRPFVPDGAARLEGLLRSVSGQGGDPVPPAFPRVRPHGAGLGHL